MLEGRCLHHLFEARARRHPERVAVSAPGEELTYGRLDARADALAAVLRRRGVGAGVLVGLCVDRSADLLVGMIGILKAGGAYVPIDPAYPARRIGLLLADSGVRAVVTVARATPALEGSPAELVLLDADDSGTDSGEHRGHLETRPVAEQDLAYVIYTSGSTGRPKGVLIEHRHVRSLLDHTWQWFEFDEHDVWTLFHSPSFDFSVWEIWGALCYGGRLVVVPEPVTRTPAEFHALLRRERVTVLNQTPSAFRALIAADLDAGSPDDLALRVIVFGGERLDPAMLAPWIARRGDERPALVNMYGITETTVHATYQRVLRAHLEQPDISLIGAPIPDLQVHLLDDTGSPVAEGTPGRIHVAGARLARGYLNRAALTAERFVERSLAGSPGRQRLYDSGDRAVQLPGGELAYLGRADDQVKVRGYRVEPGEVEACLRAHPGVATAVVTAHDYGEGDVRLRAYVTPPPGVAPIAGLDKALAERASAELPAHLRPSSYHVVPTIPMTPQGKIDREALASLAGARAPVDEQPDTGVSDLEESLIRVAEEILQRDGLRADQDLFEVGVTSLALIRILVQANQRFGVRLTGSELEEPTLKCLAACIAAQLQHDLASA